MFIECSDYEQISRGYEAVKRILWSQFMIITITLKSVLTIQLKQQQVLVNCLHCAHDIANCANNVDIKFISLSALKL